MIQRISRKSLRLFDACHIGVLAWAALILLLPTSGLAQYKVLFIGNSFTIGSADSTDRTSSVGGVPGVFSRLAQAGGQPTPTVVMRAVGGQDYEYHSTDATTASVIQSQTWTHVVMQNYSTEPTHLVDGIHSVADHYTYGTALYQKIMTASPLARVVLYQTWSRAAAHSLITGVSSPSGFASTTEFQAELRTNYQGLADFLTTSFATNPPVTVAPVGSAWQNAGGLRAVSDPAFVRLHSSDQYHGNDNGYYLAACVFYSKIYGASPVGLSMNSLVSSLNLNLTVPASYLESVAWSTVSGTSQTGVQAFLFDFGPAGMITTNGPAPQDPTNHWNNITDAIGSSPTGVLTNVITATRTATEIEFRVLSRFNGANENGTIASTILPANATRDSLYGNTELFNGQSNIFPSFQLANLNRDRTYSFTFYASRTGVTDNRESAYTITGANSGTAVLNVSENVDGTALVPGIVPDTNGTITVSIAPTANNNSAFHFTYLGALRVDAVPQQQPIVFKQEPTNVTVFAGQSVTFQAAVQGTPPYFVQWLTNGVPIAGASQFTYVIPQTTTNLDGLLFSVVVSNLAYSATSSNALLRVKPPEPNAGPPTLLFDFGGANTTALGPSPDDPVNYWNNVTTGVGATSAARLTNLVTSINALTQIGLVMVSRFNGVNENGTTTSTAFAPDATRDSLFGNTETFSGLANIFPAFKLVGLNPDAKYNLTFYASRTGASDNRETGYTVVGATTNFAALNAANNISATVTVPGVRPSASREIQINLAPTANNNNANHFTYLGVLKVEVMVTPSVFQTPKVQNGKILLNWSGSAQLEWSETADGPWTPITPRPSPPYEEPIIPGYPRYYRLVSTSAI